MNRSEKREFEGVSRKLLSVFKKTNATVFGILSEDASLVDGRKVPQYSASEMLERMLTMFLSSANSINGFVEEEIVNKHLEGPVARTYAYYLENTDIVALNNILWRFFYAAMRAKKLDVLRGPNNRLTLALDGVYLTSSTSRHCNKCLWKIINGIPHFYHAFLVASIVDRDNKFSFPIAVIPLENSDECKKKYAEFFKTGLASALSENNQPDAKQDCELNAAHRLLKFLRSKSPHTKFNISTDGLYLSASFVSEAIEMGHSVTMPLAKENMKICEILDIILSDCEKKVELSENSTETIIWWDDMDVSEFWDALKSLNEKIKLFGIKRELIDLKTGEIISTIVVTTLDVTSDKSAEKISDLQRSKWQEENKTFNTLKNHLFLKHIFNHKAAAQVFQIAAIALNLRSLFILKCKPQENTKKPLTETNLFKALLKLCKHPLDIFKTELDPTLTATT